MGAPYTSTAVQNYNANPPPDDGSTVPANRVDWSKHKEKLGDPLKVAFETSETNTQTGFTKVIGGGGVTSTAISYGISASDQGKLVRATASGITLTTPAAATVTSPFVVALLNNSSGTITVDGNGSETIDGNASVTLGAGQGCFLFTDGTNWFTAGVGAIPAGNQMGAGQIINGTIAEANATNAVTFAVKTLAGADPSVTDPVVVAFRNATAGTGNYVYRSITSALSIVIPSTALMGATNGVPFKLWLVLFDDAGTLRLGVINCLSGTSIYPLGQFPLASSTTIGTGADSAHVFYTGTGVTSKPYVVLGYAAYETDGLATAGSWNESPTRLHLQGPGDPLPGDVVQVARTATGTNASGTTTIPRDNTIPQNTEGVEFMTRAITPTSSANLLEIDVLSQLGANDNNQGSAALFQDSVANALAVTGFFSGSVSSNCIAVPLNHSMLAGTLSATTFKLRAGMNSAATIYFNSTGNEGAIYGGTSNSFMHVTERVA
jgi:hypothetical protein